MSENRSKARQLAQQHIERGDPLGWFEALYADAGEDFTSIPWADLSVNPNVMDWLQRCNPEGTGKRALVIGCGLGDDAEELAKYGYDVTAFDISETAIACCRTRFPASTVDYCVADTLAPPSAWLGRFDFVLESYTLQVLPGDLQLTAMEAIADCVAPGGTLLVIARGREINDPPGSMPWPLLKSEMDPFKHFGLTEKTFEDYMDGESAPVRRFRVEYSR